MKYIGIILIFLASIFAQTWDNHSELNWKFFETEHFIFYFHKETERTALEAKEVAEAIYEPVTSLYNFYPDTKTSIIIKDTDDYSNGAAMFFENKIEIWAKPMDFDLRGSHRWMQDVLTHEFVHIIQLGAALKYSNKVPAIYFQSIDYEDEKRDDVLYGYPNNIISFPIPGASVPPWFAEGVAQYMYNKAFYDFWDSHRDMILRDAVLNNNLFTYQEMSSFGKKGIGNEVVYNQGFAFVNYIVSLYGEKVLKEITDQISKAYIYSIDLAFYKVTGDDIQAVFDDFSDFLSELYSDYQKKDFNEIIYIEQEGTANIKPSWSDDGKSILFLSDKGNDFFNKTDLYIYKIDEKETEKLVSGVKGTASWINDSTIIYSKISLPDKNGSKFFDIYRYNLSSEKEDRLTFGERLYSPSYNKELGKVLAVTQYDGTSNLSISDYSDSLKFDLLTNYKDGFQIFNAIWKNNQILFDAVSLHGRDIYEIGLDSQDFEIVNNHHDDERDPAYYANKDLTIWAEDKNKVFNLYYTKDSNIIKITDVNGGAFFPSISSDGKLAFSIYEEGKYKLALIENFENLNKIETFNPEWNSFLEEAANKTHNIVVDKDKFQNIPIYKDYEPEKLNILLMPRIFIDYKEFKPGFYLFSNDVLEKLYVFAGGGINKKKDLDLFLQFENHNYSHTPYINLFWITRNKTILSNYENQLGQVHDNISIDSGILFSLFSADIGTRFSLISDSEIFPGRHKFWINYQFNNYREKVEQTIYQYNQNNEVEFYDNYDFSFDYYRSNIFSIQYEYKKQKNHYMKNMLPLNGYDINLKLSYELNDFLNGFGIYEDSGTFGSILSENNTFRIEVDFNKHWTLAETQKITLSSNTSLGYLSDTDIDDFFYFFGGGMPGLKGYTYYDEQLKGTNKIIQSLYFRGPLFTEKTIPLFSSFFQHMTYGLVLQAGKFESNFNDNEIFISKGLEIRLYGYNFYSYPLAINYEYHLPDSDKEGKHYFKLLFDF